MTTIKGFKAFNQGLITRFGDKIELGKTYTVSGEIKYRKNGFHFCKRPEDTLRYVDGMNENIEICRVIGSGTIDESMDDYYEYYNLYASSNIKVISILERKEIIDITLENGDIERIIFGLKLSNDEITYILNNYDGFNKLLTRYIDYYQKGDKNAFTRNRY